MRTILRMPKVQIIGILLLLFAAVASLIGLKTASYLFVTCVGFSALFDIASTYLRRKKFFIPYAAIVTGLILSLIIDPEASWSQILVICATAMGVKNFARFGNRHVLNPAASGLFFGWMFFGLNPSWWGATLYSSGESLFSNVLIYALILPIAIISCYRLGRYNTVLSYILFFTLLIGFVTSSFSPSAIIRTIINPGLLFYSLLMLPEPMTSPVNKKRQIMYGSTVAVVNALLVYITFNYPVGNFPDSSLVALFIGNILFFKYR